MTRILNVHFLPELANPHDLAGHTSIVIDVLRASTTITTALSHGAEKVIPCLTVEEARQLSADRPGSLLGGERDCQRLPGFDFGNSPIEYSPDKVRGKTIVFTTTNGTKAMTRCMGSARILIGSLVNRNAVCQAAENDSRVDLICAGTNGSFTMEDALAAGAIVDGLLERQSEFEQLNDEAETCRRLWLADSARNGSVDLIEQSLSRSQGGRNLIAVGMEDDLRFASDLDTNDHAPELDKSVWEIR